MPLKSLIANQSGPGWVGGDATYSTALPNGKEAFVFSDTLVGTAHPAGANVNAFVHSSELVGTRPACNLTPRHRYDAADVDTRHDRRR